MVERLKIPVVKSDATIAAALEAMRAFDVSAFLVAGARGPELSTIDDIVEAVEAGGTVKSKVGTLARHRLGASIEAPSHSYTAPAAKAPKAKAPAPHKKGAAPRASELHIPQPISLHDLHLADGIAEISIQQNLLGALGSFTVLYECTNNSSHVYRADQVDPNNLVCMKAIHPSPKPPLQQI